MIRLKDFIKNFPLDEQQDNMPWDIIKNITTILKGTISQLGNDFIVSDGVAVHKSAIIENGVVLKAPIIISGNCFIGAHAYLRGGVYLGESVSIGPGCEIKTSIISSESCISHFNFIGDSIIGSHVNFEAGSVTANYHNDKPDKKIYSFYNSTTIVTGVDKFGSLVGDGSKIGANAVLSPGTLLPKNTIVKRLQLIDQFKS